MSDEKTIKAKEVKPGGLFRRSQGHLAFIRMSPGAVRAHSLRTDMIYGVSHNGNMCRISFYTDVVPLEPEALLRNRYQLTDTKDTHQVFYGEDL